MAYHMYYKEKSFAFGIIDGGIAGFSFTGEVFSTRPSLAPTNGAAMTASSRPTADDRGGEMVATYQSFKHSAKPCEAICT